MLCRTKEDLCSRLDTLRLDHESVESMCVRFGISKTSWHMWRRGAGPSDEVLDRISQRSCVSPFWLKYGIGPRDMESVERWLEEQTVGEQGEHGEGN